MAFHSICLTTDYRYVCVEVNAIIIYKEINSTDWIAGGNWGDKVKCTQSLQLFT